MEQFQRDLEFGFLDFLRVPLIYGGLIKKAEVSGVLDPFRIVYFFLTTLGSVLEINHLAYDLAQQILFFEKVNSLVSLRPFRKSWTCRDIHSNVTLND